MRGWSLPIGTFFGVEVRVHIFCLILLGLCIGYASMLEGNGGRGIVLWLLLLVSVAVREIARAFGAAWWGLKLRSILLLPTNGLFAYADGEATERANTPAMQRRLALIGPTANLLFGLTLASIVLTITPQVDFLVRPFILPGHLLRAFIWSNLLLGLLHLVPALPLDCGRVLRAEMIKVHGSLKALRSSSGLTQVACFLVMVTGFYTNNLWGAIMGGFVLFAANLEDPGFQPATETDTVKMRDVMLTEYSTLSASDTLEDALQRSVHVMQDVFPVVRGVSMVGAVSRQSLVEALASQGNGYVQGVMTRSFQSAHPDDSLVKTLRRVMAGRGAQLLPVLEGERVVGIITPQNLAQSMGMLNRTRRLRAQN